MAVQRFAYPQSVDEALAVLADPDHKAIALGGGTTLSQGGRRGAEVLVDLSRCGLADLAVDGQRIALGAGLRCEDIARANLPGAAGAVLSQAAAGIASQPLRNVITLGGNLFHLASWSDLPVALLALDAEVQVAHRDRGRFTLPVAELVARPPVQVLPPGALILGVTVAVDDGVGGGCCGGVYRRFRQSEVDYALISVAAVVEVDAARVVRARIAVGAVGPRPQRAALAETRLCGQPASATLFADAARQVVPELSVAKTARMPEAIRRRVLEVEIRRAIEAAHTQAKTAQGGATCS